MELRDESEFPTVRFLKCKDCGTVFTGSLTGENACPQCQAPAEVQLPDEDRFKLEINELHGLLSIQGSLHKIQELEELRSEIRKIPIHEIRSLAFAFQNSSFLNSSLINILVMTIKALTNQGKPTYVITSEASVLEGLQTMDLDRLVKIFPDLERYKAELKLS